MANVFDVAKYILDKYGAMSAMKLQKLCYYSQEMSLVWDDVPLFDGEFEAFLGNFTDDEKEILVDVDNAFGQYSAWKLIEMSQQERPWRETPHGGVISVDKIKAYFDKHHVEEVNDTEIVS